MLERSLLPLQVVVLLGVLLAPFGTLDLHSLCLGLDLLCHSVDVAGDVVLDEALNQTRT
jgi:hypothetical protein